MVKKLFLTFALLAFVQPILVTGRNFTERECLLCKFSVGLVDYALSTRRGAERVHRIANSFCTIAHIESPIVCSQVTKLFNHEIVKVIAYGVVTPDQVCGYMSNNTCGTFHDPLADWEVNLNVSISLNQDDIAKLNHASVASGEASVNTSINQDQAEKSQPSQQRQFRVLQISDTHVDMRYQEGSPAVCEEPLCCRADSRQANNSKLKSGYWGTYADCDVPDRTFETTLKVINATIERAGDIDYIIWTGDIQPHDVWKQNRQTALDTFDTVFAKIFKYLPNIRIFPTLGNHEMTPVDSFSPSGMLSIAKEDSPEWLYKKLDSFWSRWLPLDTVSTITKDGFYSTIVRPGLRLISLNTNFCHKTNFWLYINSTDPGDQLKWLIHELQLSELSQEKVHIIGHIPPGSEDCLKTWSRNYNRIVRRFANTVTGQYFGHTHNGEFAITYDNKRKDFYGDPDSPTWRPVAASFIAPSMTTFVGLNPSFRIYTMDPSQGFQTRDFETFYMNLTAANMLGDRGEPEWHSTGAFTQIFGIQNVSASSLHALLLDIAKDLKVQEASKTTRSESKIYKLYRLFNSFSDYFDENRFKSQTSAQVKQFLCRFFTSQSHDASACDRFLHMT